MKKAIFILGMAFCCQLLMAQKSDDAIYQYVEQFRDIAMSEMQRTGIPASITLAQGILESAAGKSRLAKQGNNHFGIKCHKGWTGGTMKHTDDAPDECFRTYNSAYDSYMDHSAFLTGRERYNNCFNFPSDDYVNWARELKKAGYATNPIYAEKLIEKIEQYYLYIYDKPNWNDLVAIVQMNREMSGSTTTSTSIATSTSTSTSVATPTQTSSPVVMNEPLSNGLAPGEYVIREYVPSQQEVVTASAIQPQVQPEVQPQVQPQPQPQPQPQLQEQPQVQILTQTEVQHRPEVVDVVTRPEYVEPPVVDSYVHTEVVPEPIIEKDPLPVRQYSQKPPAIVEEKPSFIESVSAPKETVTTLKVVEKKAPVTVEKALPIKPSSHLTFFNRRKVVMYNYGVTPEKVAGDYDVMADRIAKFNELERKDYIEANTKIFLQPKRKKGPWGKPYHKVLDGETIYEIAQIYGVKSKRLKKMNLMAFNDEPLAGEVIYLRKKREYPPKTNLQPDGVFGSKLLMTKNSTSPLDRISAFFRSL